MKTLPSQTDLNLSWFLICMLGADDSIWCLKKDDFPSTTFISRGKSCKRLGWEQCTKSPGLKSFTKGEKLSCLWSPHQETEHVQFYSFTAFGIQDKPSLHIHLPSSRRGATEAGLDPGTGNWEGGQQLLICPPWTNCASMFEITAVIWKERL